MKTAVHDEHNVDTRRLAKEAFLSKSIRLEQTALHGPDAQLVLKVRTVQGSQIKVGGGVRDSVIKTVGPEDI